MPTSRRTDTITRLVKAAAPPAITLPAWLNRLGSYGVVTSDPEVADRQRFTTFVCYASAANALSHLAMNFVYAGWPLWPVHLYNALFTVVVLLIPRLHPFGPNVAATAIALLVMVGHLFIVFALGSSSDLHVYFVLVAGVIFMYGIENWRAYCTWFVVAAVEILISVHLAPAEGLIAIDAVELRKMLSGHAYINAVAIIFLFVFVSQRQVRRAQLSLQEAHRRSESLLGAMLPGPIAERLKAAPERHIADRIDGLAVLFADLVGFTEAAHDASPEEVVTYLDEIYRRFDELATAHGVEKIKTIGDCYLAIASAQGDARERAIALGRLALALREFLRSAPPLGGVQLALRVGLHSGAATAGVIGTTRFTYDVWGDAVNTASRMETNARPGEIQASVEFAALTADVFEFEPRGPIEVKGLGRIETRLLRGLRAESGTAVPDESADMPPTEVEEVPPRRRLV